MDKSNIQSKAAGMLRKILNRPEPAPTLGKESKPAAEPASPAEPAKTTN